MKMLLPCLLVLVLCTTSVSGEDESFAYIGPGIGIPLSSGDWNTGLAVSGGFGFLINRTLEISCTMAHNTFQLNEEHALETLRDTYGSLPGVELSGGKLRMLEVELDFKYHMYSLRDAIGLTPYSFCGVGIVSTRHYNIDIPRDVDFGTQNVGSSGPEPYVTYGLGTKYRIASSVDLYIDGRYILEFRDGLWAGGYFPIRLGLSISAGN